MVQEHWAFCSVLLSPRGCLPAFGVAGTCAHPDERQRGSPDPFPPQVPGFPLTFGWTGPTCCAGVDSEHRGARPQVCCFAKVES